MEANQQLQLIKILEALLFASDEPLTLKRMKDALNDFEGFEEPKGEQPEPKEGEAAQEVTEEPKRTRAQREAFNRRLEEGIGRAMAELKEKYSSTDAPIVILEVAQGWQMATNPIYSQWVKKLFKHRVSFRLSQAALETLAIVAYKQPITRAEIEQIRGVEVIASLETVLERGLVRVSGRRETVGRPLLYSTSSDFLKQFGLRSIEDLPPMETVTVIPSTNDHSETTAEAQETVEPKAETEPVETEPVNEQ